MAVSRAASDWRLRRVTQKSSRPWRVNLGGVSPMQLVTVMLPKGVVLRRAFLWP